LANHAERVALGLEGDDQPSDPPPPPIAGGASLPELLERYEADLIRDALQAHAGDAQATIEALGLPRKTFYDKLKRHGIRRADFDPVTGTATEP
jgi:two-component system C4-dicarboxylate transport response regulator DctD